MKETIVAYFAKFFPESKVNVWGDNNYCIIAVEMNVEIDIQHFQVIIEDACNICIGIKIYCNTDPYDEEYKLFIEVF